MEAQVQMTGYVGSDVDLRNQTIPVAYFRLACTPRVQRGPEWVDGETTWITVKGFRGLATSLAASVHKGDAVIVVGRLRTTVWTKDGVTNERLELEAMTVGHDLRRGTATFTRAPRAGQPDEAADQDDSGTAASSAAASQAADDREIRAA